MNFFHYNIKYILIQQYFPRAYFQKGGAKKTLKKLAKYDDIYYNIAQKLKYTLKEGV